MREKSILIILTTAVLEILMYNRTPGTDNKGNLLALALQQLHAWFIKIHRRIWLFFLVKIPAAAYYMHAFVISQTPVKVLQLFQRNCATFDDQY